MKAPRRSALPLAPLLRAYRDAGPPTGAQLSRLPVYGERVRAVLAAPHDLLSDAFLDGAGDQEFQAALERFYEACVQPPLHGAALRRRAGFLRHALTHLRRCPDPLPQKAERCLAADGPYHVVGLGPAFWSALFQALDATQYPAWTPAVVLGLRRLGLARWPGGAGPAQVYAALAGTYARLLDQAPGISALHLDHFFTLAAGMQGRDLASGTRWLAAPVPGLDLPAVIRQERARVPLRRRLKERGKALAAARAQLEAGLAAQDGSLIGAALRAADPAGAARATLDWQAHAETLTLWVGRLWEADEPLDLLDAFWRADPLPAAGLWLPAAVLHLRDPHQFHAWDDTARQGYALLAAGADRAGRPAERYRLFNEGVSYLRQRQRLHPLEAPAVLAGVAAAGAGAEGPPEGFGGFCPDTFRFLEELGRHNSREWMTGQRDRYHFAVRAPLVELCRALAERYVRPVLQGQWGWEMETAARSGRALTSIVKNDYGRSVPYHTALWITFCRRGPWGRRHDAQFFVRLDAGGVSFGLRLGREAREAGRLLRQNVQEHAELLHRALAAGDALAGCRFGAGDDLATARPLDGPGDLRAWAAGKTLIAGKHLPAGTPLLAADELVGEILLTFDRLLPAYVCAVSAEAAALLARRAGAGRGAGGCTEGDFCRATFLPPAWLRRARALLDLKRQLILQGVPGTGKTHVAHTLARLLTAGREGAIRLVQFHPAYSYEEFVEGIRAKSVEVNGRHEVTYPVEEGLLSAFAAEAGRCPAEPYVLIIDEINRGNLPRVFGELLYLLEYRGQSVALPYSKRSFRLPANLYLIGTMNAADRSVALVDQALRRRFSFLEMPPDAAVLAAWLRANPPRGGADFASRVVALFERLNGSLGKEAGPHCRVGHSYFMVPDLDEGRLRVVWEHQVRPLLEEYFPGQPGPLDAYTFDRLWQPGRKDRRPATAAG